MTDFRNNGLTPGYWKNHTEVWDGTGGDDILYAPPGLYPTDLSPDFRFETLFGISASVTFKNEGADGCFTLLEALSGGGGGKDALARHATAAFLNASREGEEEYLLWHEEIVEAVQFVFGGPGGGTYNAVYGERLINIFEFFNELQGAELVNTTEPSGDYYNSPGTRFFAEVFAAQGASYGWDDLLADPNWYSVIDPWITG